VTLQLEESGAVRCDECGPDRRHRIGDVVRVWIDRHGFYLCPEHRADLHRLTAPPVEAAGERGPCDGWGPWPGDPDVAELVAGHIIAHAWQGEFTDQSAAVVGVRRICWQLFSFDHTDEGDAGNHYRPFREIGGVERTLDAAKLAAESAARKLLDEARARLGVK
jgi:hypothetical protein